MKNKKQLKSKSKNRFGPASQVRKLWVCPICGFSCKNTWDKDKHKLAHTF